MKIMLVFFVLDGKLSITLLLKNILKYSLVKQKHLNKLYCKL